MRVNKLAVGLYEDSDVVFINTVELPREPMTVQQFEYFMDKMKESTGAYLKEMGLLQ